MRIVAGAWRGRTLVAPPGVSTRPTADRVRQALFDMLLHADWGGRGVIEDAVVLDVFAGTGALGLEALSRGAAFASFIESDPVALRALRVNVAACKAEDRTEVVAANVLTAAIGRPRRSASLVFLDPPYGHNLVSQALARLKDLGWIGMGALIVAETGSEENWTPDQPVLAERLYGAARVVVSRAG
jgi:16S rRNA (guanine966-N2)-methyltransferase